MSRVHKVINLKEPLKLGGFTIKQILCIVAFGVPGLILATKMPGDIKIGNLPIGLFVFVIVVGIGMGLGFMTEVKPLAWWRASLMFTLGLVPKTFIPKPEKAPIYPDPTIIEQGQTEEFYIESFDKE